MNETVMNCVECRDNLVACLEGLLEAEQARQCQAHLESCAACRAEYAAISRLQERLAARGRVAAEVALVEPVMRAVRRKQIEPERTTLMSLILKNEQTGTDWSAYVKGKTIAVGPVGGTPNSITRYLLKKWNLDAKSDVTLTEVANSAVLPVVRGKQAQIGVSTEPFVTQGVRLAVWSEPFYNVPKELGPYAYSTLNVRLDTIQKDPELVRTFVRGMVKALKFTYASPDEAAAIAKTQFPTMALEDLRATLDRSFKDEMWSKDGMISKQSWATAKAVVREAGILKADISYEDIIDMGFVASA